MSAKLRSSLLLAAASIAPAALSAQLRPVTCCNKGPAIVYDIAFPNAAHHEAAIKATFTALPKGPVTFRMARSSPGRYALTEYAENVNSVTAMNSRGKQLPVVHGDPYSWTVSGHDGTVTLSYNMYA
ncbi:MAG: M61 family metallopeptidase, partial [Gemmatimonadaceae bacterium]